MVSRLGRRGGGVGTYLQEGDDERSQGKVGGFLQLGVEFLDGQGGILQSKEKRRECMWKPLSHITYWKLSYILALERVFMLFFAFSFFK